MSFEVPLRFLFKFKIIHSASGTRGAVIVTFLASKIVLRSNFY